MVSKQVKFEGIMKPIVLSIFLILIFNTLSISCNPRQTVPTMNANMPNPASVYCEEQGYSLEIITASDGSQRGICIFPDGSSCDEWTYFRGECGPIEQGGSSDMSTDVSTALPFTPADYQDWWTYTDSSYGFSLQLPPDWILDESESDDPLLHGHLLMFHPKKDTNINLVLRMTFRHVGDETLLWPTGVGSGEFLPQGTLDVARQPVRRILFVCPTGQINGIWYHGKTDANIQRGNLEFGFILTFTGVYCEEGYSLGGETQRVGEMIIASLTVP